MVDTLRPWRATARAASFLATADAIDPVLARSGGIIELPEDLDVEHLTEVLEVVDRALASDEPVVVLLEGQDGAGRRTVAALAARRHGRQAIMLDLGAGPADPARPAHELRALVRECWLRGAIPVVARFDTLLRDGQPTDRLAELLSIIDEYRRPGDPDVDDRGRHPRAAPPPDPPAGRAATRRRARTAVAPRAGRRQRRDDRCPSSRASPSATR